MNGFKVLILVLTTATGVGLLFELLPAPDHAYRRRAAGWDDERGPG